MAENKRYQAPSSRRSEALVFLEMGRGGSISKDALLNIGPANCRAPSTVRRTSDCLRSATVTYELVKSEAGQIMKLVDKTVESNALRRKVKCG